ncbi:DUF202 domain-containing protein [Cellulomonas soli]|uniref:DUF202 domain-containing protein n=1 Tax=Cellulomonas soli TaxID=931535 RepID=A0A512PIG3_9CELL|nr:DUF202 domain-containing protein [Cellulomonas soli]NYI59978.1 putative membrane protein [Cellulomonas soli]GEP71001.1 hypothetical protein CSO01_37160 [Cellulomonas soli]
MSLPDGRPNRPVRPGLAVERTALAWRRTGLALATGALAGGRLLEQTFGPVAWLITAAALLAAGVVTFSAHTRSRAAHGVVPPSQRETTGSLVGRTGGRLVTACAAGAAVLGLIGLAIVLRLG